MEVGEYCILGTEGPRRAIFLEASGLCRSMIVTVGGGEEEMCTMLAMIIAGV
jgi:hypothetical protein